MKSFAVLAVAAILGPAALAQHQTFAVDAEASEVKMKLNTTHEVVDGTFHVQSGSINFDRTASHISGIVIVAAVRVVAARAEVVGAVLVNAGNALDNFAITRDLLVGLHQHIVAATQFVRRRKDDGGVTLGFADPR